ncbi:hypothetical protein PFICI_04284 [Pestalotiopsis fici W106-1]|uniref:Uncharacterized protein n=1 Tax=Pestalotiopsis fici (strain W106-1 / CGMCC3.15140) TaxID=1229662 RepID=W3X8G3_PESFW|nr:uncharacterized protein PFICI_04284 [Pestalotiopsis fici W106-1]ETS82408.1 hypothetical protein PFICI_04284 [Pestalotiopsis fici W106-1]
MTPPVPVPSKAAIHALRGLALGSSCALGLIVEDRRRRISTLKTAVDNNKKIRTSRQYHGATEALRQAVEDAAVLSGQDIHWHYDAGPSISLEHGQYRATTEVRRPSNTQTDARTVDKEERNSVAEHQAKQLAPQDGPKPRMNSSERTGPRIHAIRPSVGLTTSTDSGGWARPARLSKSATPADKIAEILDLPVPSIKTRLQEPGMLATYKAAFIAGTKMRGASKKKQKEKLNEQWLNVSEALCTYCQENELWQDAQEILGVVVGFGEVDETRFYAHNPFSVIDSLLRDLEADGDAVAGKLDLATRLFVANFEHEPALNIDKISQVAQDLIPRLLQYHQIRQAHQVYWRVLKQLDQTADFTAWFIERLSQYGDHKSVIKYFRLNFTKAATKYTTFETTVNRVLDSVEAMRGARAEPVARALLQCSRFGLTPKAEWLQRLLQSHWDRYQDLQKSHEFFHELVNLGLLSTLKHPESVYQFMVKFAALDGHSQVALYYYEETLKLAPHMRNDVWLNGCMTLTKAKHGCWDDVYLDYSEMRQYARSQPAAYSQAFVALLKVFLDSHTVAETEDFIQTYVEKMDVRLHRYVITLVANKYGEVHDYEGLLAWLQYCRSQGLELDAAFTNAILRNLRLKWKFPYRQLQRVYKRIRRLDLATVDLATTRIMHGAAMEEGNYAGTNIKKRLGTLGTSPSKLPYTFKSANERDVLHAMTEELLRGNPVRAVVIYKRALRFGMPWCPRCFRVAVKASLKRKGENFSITAKLISDTYAEGHDITGAASILIKSQITQFRGPFEEVMANLQSLTTRFESLGLTIESSVMTHAAIMSTQFKQHTRAVEFCRLAMEQSGATNPCFSRQSMRALLSAYWQTLDPVGLRWVVESLPSSPLAADKHAFHLLKSTRRHMLKWNPSSRVNEIIEILEDGIDRARQQRKVAIQVGSLMHNETLRIMSDAAGNIDLGRTEHGHRGQQTNHASDMEKTTLAPDMRTPASVQAYG